MSGGALDASVTLDEVLTVVGARRVPLAPELAGYLVLEIAEQTDPQGGDIDVHRVYVGDEGTVALVRMRREAPSGDAESSIRTALARLLEASGSQTPSLSAASRRKNGAGLPALIEELEAALIPVNRAAGRRALARLAREVKRVTLGVGRHTLTASGARSGPREIPPPSSRLSPRFAREEEPTTTQSPIPKEIAERSIPANWSEMPTTEFAPASRAPSPSDSDVDSLIADFGVTGGGDQQHAQALGAMVGLDATPPPRESDARAGPAQGTDRSTPAPLRPGEDADVEALLALDERSPVAARTRPGSGTPPSPPVAAAPSPAVGHAIPTRPERVRPPVGPGVPVEARQLPTQPSQRRRPAASSLPNAQHASRWRGGALAVVAIAAVGAGTYAVWRLRPTSPVDASSARAEPVASALPAREVPPPCYGTLIVTDVPVHAEVLLREGQAPLDIPRMPVGARLEFVATAEGYAPKRVVVPAGVPWDPAPDGKPRFEAAVQLDSTGPRDGAESSWPAGEPGSEVGGQGRPGTVHVVATPRGSEIWMLAGIGPEARIDQVRCDQDIDVLVAGPTTYRKRLHVTTADYVSGETGTRAAAGRSAPPTARITAK